MKLFNIPLLVISFTIVPFFAFAEGTEADVVYRQKILESIGYTTQNIMSVLKDEAGRPSHIVSLAEALAAHASLLSTAFEKDTRDVDAKTEAKPLIWDNIQDFQDKAEKFSEVTSNFATQAAEEDVSLKDFQIVLTSCKSCHKDYKE